MEALICIFAKPPASGAVKTRLGLPPATARALAQAFLDDTLESTALLGWADIAIASTAPMDAGVPVLLQGEGDLGARLERVLREALTRAPVAIAIGADAPALPARFFEAARAALQTHDAVLGPADDGGFTLLALRSCPPGLLADLPWSAAETAARTLERLRARGFSTAVLEPWFDVDRPDDLVRLRAAIDAGAIVAPRTLAVLATLPAMSAATLPAPGTPR